VTVARRNGDGTVTERSRNGHGNVSEMKDLL
jgi:YD repeat-containing protein